MRIGDRLRLDFCMRRMNGGRSEILDVRGEFRVSSVSFDATGVPRQVIQVEAIGKSPVWRAVKKAALPVRKIAPSCSPPTKVT